MALIQNINICGKCGKPIEICSAVIYIRVAAEKLESLEPQSATYYLNLAINLMKRLAEEQDK